ncbi:MAG: hypothetical protein QOF73_3760 [Thermomicrobiales bacterium]|nr:hypothetical protein [Thermomicrobiales bacterium]
MASPQFRAGVGRAIITPPLSMPHASWGAQTHVLPDGVETDLWLTVLVVGDGTTTAAIVDLDLMLISRAESDAIRNAVAEVLAVPPQAVRVAVTHSHAGPPASSYDWIKEGAEALQGYYRLLPAYAAGAARSALRDLRPARVAVGNGESHVAVNRREHGPAGRTITGVNPDGPIDPDVFVLRIDALTGDPIATIVGYTMHPTTLGPSNRIVSPDWPGHLKRTVESLTGATCIFAQGATGDVGPGPDGFTDDLSVAQRLGAQVGCEAARVWFGLRLPAVAHRYDRVWESGAPLGKWTADPLPEPDPVVRATEIEIAAPVRPQPTVEEAAAVLADAERRLADLRAAGAPAVDVEAATFAAKRANMAMTRVRDFSGKSEFPLRLHLLQIGPAVLAAVEGEPFNRIARDVKAASPATATWFGGYVGGWYGYIPTPEEYPRRGYEVDTAAFAPEAADYIVAETVAAIRGLLEAN